MSNPTTFQITLVWTGTRI